MLSRFTPMLAPHAGCHAHARVGMLSLLFAILTPYPLPLTPASAAAPTTLPAFGGGGPLLGNAEPIAAPPMTVRWTYKADEVDHASIQSSPVIANGTVYIADARGTLHAIDLQTGKPRWKYKTGDSFAATPLVYDNKVFIGDLSGIFHAVSADTGQKLWTVDTESAINSSANAAGSSILFANDGAMMFCLNAADGKILWKATGGDRINSAPAIAPAPPSMQLAAAQPAHPAPTGGARLSPDRLIAYFGGCDGVLRALDIQTGKEIFTVEIDVPIPGSPALLGDRLVVGTDLGRVIGINVAQRQILWTWQNPDSEMLIYASPAIADGLAVVGARDRQVHAIDLQTGLRKWAFRTRGDVDAAPVISAGRVYAPSKDKSLYVLDLKTGRLLWQFNAGRAIEAAVAIASNLLILADTSGTVFCLQPK